MCGPHVQSSWEAQVPWQAQHIVNHFVYILGPAAPTPVSTIFYATHHHDEDDDDDNYTCTNISTAAAPAKPNRRPKATPLKN